MIHNYVDEIYVINLDRRKDRLEECTAEFDKIGSSFTRIPAIDGASLDIDVQATAGKRWNKSAYALTLTTIDILRKAIEKKQKKILIFEDDIEFHPLMDIIGKDYLDQLPKKFDFAFLGYTPTGSVTDLNAYWLRYYSGFSCHAYIIHDHIMPAYLKMLEKLDNPIDYYTNIIMGGRLNSIAARPYNNCKLVYQKSGISDIEGGYYNVEFTK